MARGAGARHLRRRSQGCRRAAGGAPDARGGTARSEGGGRRPLRRAHAHEPRLARADAGRPCDGAQSLRREPRGPA
jgi:hypothetical protein